MIDLTEWINAIKRERDTEIMQALGFNSMPPMPLIDYLQITQAQAIAWNLLDEVIDHSVSLTVAANQLRREIEQARGIQ
jgi:hypothetical protein